MIGKLKLFGALAGLALLGVSHRCAWEGGANGVRADWNAEKAEVAQSHVEALKAAQARAEEAQTAVFEAERALLEREGEHERIQTELRAQIGQTKTIRQVVRVPVEGECPAVPTLDLDRFERVLNGAIRAHRGEAPTGEAGSGDAGVRPAVAAAGEPAGSF